MAKKTDNHGSTAISSPATPSGKMPAFPRAAKGDLLATQNGTLGGSRIKLGNVDPGLQNRK